MTEDYLPAIGGNVTHLYGGIQIKTEYENGYGASVIRHTGSYGYREGLFELAVLHKGHLCYSTPITNDVNGYLTAEEVEKQVKEIEALPKNNKCTHAHHMDEFTDEEMLTRAFEAIQSFANMKED